MTASGRTERAVFTTEMIVTFGVNVRTITAETVAAMIRVDILNVTTIGTSQLIEIAAKVGSSIEMLEMAAMKTTLFAMKIVTAKKGASMITSWTAVTVAGGTAPSELAAWAVTVLAAPNLVRTLWLNFHLPKFVFRN
jgi:hypothetical protein